MDGTAIDTDIDRFIRQQKSKLAAERHDLQNDDEDYYPKRSPRRQWGEPNKENYLSVDVKRQTEEKPATPAHQGYPVDNRLVVKKRKELSVERKKEYNDFLKTQPNNQRKPRNLTPTQKSINVGEYDERRKAMLNAERKKDYDDFMRKKKKKSDRLKPSSEKLPIDDFNHYYYGGVNRQHDDDYYGDYGLRAQLDSPDENFYLEELNRSPRVGGLPVGQYEQHKREFGHAIKANYRNDLQKQMKDNKKLLKYKPGYKSKKPAKDDRRQYYIPDDKVYDIERILDKSPRVGGLPVGQYEQRKRDHADETKRKYRHDLEKQVNFKQTLGKTQPGYKGDPMKQRTRDPMLRRQLRVQGSTGKSFDKWERKLHEPIKTLYDKGHDLRPYDLDDEWKRHQLDALNDIDRRQLELRLKIERDNARRHLEHTAPPVLSDEDVEEVSNCPVHIVRENSRSPSPVVVPRLYDPDQLEMYRESPEGLLIGETSTEHKEKLRQERQREYNEMMAQKRTGNRRRPPAENEDGGLFRNRPQSSQRQRTDRDRLLLDQKNVTPRTWREPSKEDLLLDDKRESYRKKLEEERKNDYNEHLKTALKPRVTWKEPSKEQLLIEDDKDNKRREQAEERKKEYQDLLKKQRGSRREWREPSQEQILIKDSDERKRKLEEERRKEYQELLENQNHRQREWREPSQEQLLIKDREETNRRTKMEERNREYNNSLLEKKQRPLRNDLPPKPGTPGGFMNKLGSHEKQRQRLQEERHREYQRLQAEKRGDFDDPRMLKSKDEDIYATLPGLNYHGSATQRTKEKLRNEEYNRFKDVFDTPRSGRGEEPPGAPRKGWGTPTYEEMLEKKRNEEQRYRRLNDPEYSRPGLKAYNSEGALHRLEDEKRLKDLERDAPPKKSILQNGILDNPDWLSPIQREHDRAYSRLLERLQNWDSDLKDEEEKKEDSTTAAPPPDKPSNKDHGPAARPQVVHEYPPRPIREAPSYLPEANKHRFYATLPVGEKDSAEEIQRRKEAYKQELDRQMQEAENARRRNRSEELKEDERKQALVPAPPRPPVQPQVIVIPEAQKPPQVQVVREGGQRAYPDIPGIDRLSPRSELLLGRTRDLERLQKRLAKIEQQQNGLSQFDLAELDFISKRDPRKQTYQAGLGSTGILEQGFDTLLEPPKLGAVKAPPGLLYQPPTYVTGGDQFDKFNTVDQAYHFYGARNPLDITEAAAVTNYGAGPVGGGGVVIGNYGAGGGVTGGGRVSPIHVVDQQVRGLGQAETLDGTDTEKKARQKAQAQQYQIELERQIEEKRRKKEYEREEQERYERKLEEDIRNYNPYGRGGGGAPMKDSSGNIIADLRALQKGYTSPRYQDPYTSPRNIARPPSPKDDLIKTPPVQTTMLGENSHARGGHGIFGNPKTEAEKTQADRYKDDLQRQIEKKKRDAELEKERERREEEKQNKIVEEQRLKMQAEYEEEKRRIQAKEEEARLRNLEIVRIQEERKTEEEKLKEELEKKKREEARIDYERERLAREEKRGESPPVPAARGNKADQPNPESPKKQIEKSEPNDKPEKKVVPSHKSVSPVNHPVAMETGVKSPPLPALKNKLADDTNASISFDHRTDSPLIPTLRHKTDAYNHSEPAARTNSADVLNQLAHMRRQLQSERKRVETMLEETMNEPEVYDPRLSQGVAIPIQHQVQVIPNNNIFDTAVNRNAVHVRRAGTTDPANPSVLQEFSHLKHKDNTDSRKDFRQMYPNDPRTQSELESQQAAFIRQQEERIRYGVSPSDRVLDSSSPQTMLHSQSAFIDVDRNSFPDDFDDLPRRNDSARQRRREREQVDRYPSAGIRDPNMPRNYNPMGSVTSIDVDHISRKNEDRLKRLKELQGDDVSLYDPDDVLNRFMEKQSHNRPPTRNTLHDDSWLLPSK